MSLPARLMFIPIRSLNGRNSCCNRGCLYLVAVMDLFSRYVLSWEVLVTLESEFCVSAMEQVLSYCAQAEVYGGAVGTPVALQAPSVPTALAYGDESTLKTLSFCLDNG